MKANTQYNDLIGTAAADVEDHFSNQLSNIAEKYGISKEKYRTIGVHFYNPFRRPDRVFRFYLILEDNQSKELYKQEMQMGVEEFFSFFKRFDLYLIEKGFDHDHIRFDDIIEINDVEKYDENR